MSSPAAQVLSPSLSAKLAALASRLADSEARHALDEILAELADLPAHAIVRASREIATSAKLGWWHPETRSLRVVPTDGAALPWRDAAAFQRLRHLLGLEWSAAPVPSTSELLAADPNLAWLFLFHPSGYVREAALWHINSPPKSSFFLAALAWRLNDWVAPVRQAAKHCFKRISDEVSATVAADAALYLLERRFVWGRWRDEASILDLVFARDDVLAALVMLLQERPTGPLATCLRHALRYPGIDQHLPRLAATAVQPAVRAVAYQCVIAGKATWPAGFEWVWIDKVYGLRRRVPKLEARAIQRDYPAANFVTEGIRDRSPFVRKIVADGMISVRSQIPDEGPLVARLANDRNAAVRSRADFLLRHPPAQQES
jgi:hypothetical protein